MSEFFLTLGTALKWAGFASLPLFLLPIAILIIGGPLARLGSALTKLLDAISETFLRIAMTAAVMIILFQLALIIGRFVFNWSRNWVGESVLFGFAIMFLLGAVATLRDDEHVRVDIFRPRLSARAKAWIELIGIYMLLIPMAFLIIWVSTQFSFVDSWTNFRGSKEEDGLPFWFIFRTFIPLFGVLIAAQGLSQALKCALGLRGELPIESDTAHKGAG